MEPEREGLRFQYASDRSLLLYFDRKITLEAHHHVVKLLRLLKAEPTAGIRNLHPAYCSLLVDFDAFETDHVELQEALKTKLARLDEVQMPEPRLQEIPMCYGGSFGPDLEEVAKLHGMTPEQVVELHSSATYVVYFLGFVPGFAYLGGLPEALATPRLSSPRRTVPAGSLGIAGDQTGVYPFATPGGWRLIGRTPVRMFTPNGNEMSLLSIGDRVRFARISQERFAEMERESQ